eukprot:CAMPEP_0201523416 /NCGR_PEP_ID=MMETSP0161_2-20130828/19772_1 /ASSEMBLY_ACC=CAM_ASM_000251 /TAXON_ID=180227 /ORGANISM="Neoparamoeba aestuarina, Strain SoJaBio B1-5/56/2" /LENGTH=76 /DNA_ID=CAMNT_0047922531 /DNA_START=68 /DNA_END=298 /DNA_ORIENTATION=+
MSTGQQGGIRFTEAQETLKINEINHALSDANETAKSGVKAILDPVNEAVHGVLDGSSSSQPAPAAPAPEAAEAPKE